MSASEERARHTSTLAFPGYKRVPEANREHDERIPDAGNTQQRHSKHTHREMSDNVVFLPDRPV